MDKSGQSSAPWEDLMVLPSYSTSAHGLPLAKIARPPVCKNSNEPPFPRNSTDKHKQAEKEARAVGVLRGNTCSLLGLFCIALHLVSGI